MQREISLVGLRKQEEYRGGRRSKKKKNCTAIVNIDLDRTDNRFHSFDVLKGFHWFTYTAVRWATSKWNL